MKKIIYRGVVRQEEKSAINRPVGEEDRKESPFCGGGSLQLGRGHVCQGGAECSCYRIRYHLS